MIETTATMPRRNPPLLRQFLLLAGAVLGLGMLGIGFWVNSQISRIVLQNAGAVTALYVEAMIAPAVQGLDQPEGLSPAAQDRLSEILQQGRLRLQVSAFKIWDGAGKVVFSTRPELLGLQGRDNPRLARALSGQVHAALREVPPFLTNQPTAKPLIEVYSPIHSASSGQIIGVAEFYTTSDTLRADLFRSWLNSWLAVGLVTLAMFAALYTLFANGARTIRGQRQTLDAKIGELSAMLAQNAQLTRQVERANRRIGAIHDLTLRRISADLHDGPAQHLAFAALRLDGVAGQAQVSEAVNEALRELRQICLGLVLPELVPLDLPTILRRLTAAHEGRTGQVVHLTLTPIGAPLSPAQKTCIYRFVQESLNNAARHAAGARQAIELRRADDGLEIEISDTGPGFDPRQETEGLGLIGLRERILGLRGRFVLRAAPGQGVSVMMWLPLHAAQDPEGASL